MLTSDYKYLFDLTKIRRNAFLIIIELDTIFAREGGIRIKLDLPKYTKTKF